MVWVADLHRCKPDKSTIHPSTTVVQVYTNLKNVVARISPKPCPPGPRPALLLNCHFDSVPQVEQIFQPR